MTNDVVAVLQTFLKNFAEEVLSKTVGENVSEAAAQIREVSERLSEVNQIPLEAPTCVLQVLTKCSVPEFTWPFDLMLNQERVTQMATPVLLVYTSSNTLKRVLNILHLENNSYHSLNTSNSWSAPQVKRGHNDAQHPHHNPICFKCDDPHMLPNCKRTRNETKIARNSKAYMEKCPDGLPCNGGCKKCTKGVIGDDSDRNHGSGVKLMGNNWMCFCKRTECGWNSTHTSGFHAAWAKNKSNFSLLAKHEF